MNRTPSIRTIRGAAEGREANTHIDELQDGAVPGLGADGGLLPDGALRVPLIQHRHTALHLQTGKDSASAHMQSQRDVVHRS